MKTVHTIIVGGGQAGLATSYHLGQKQVEHLVLEQAAQIGNAWRNQRWDSFSLLTPNWTIRMPAIGYQDYDPDGFLQQAEIVTYFEDLVEQIHAPIQFGAHVHSVSRLLDESGYHVQTNRDEYLAMNVVIATGLFQTPKRPTFSSSLSSRIMQIHSSEYRSPHQLQAGGVLVIGSGQSGAQIAEELHESGLRVFLSVGGAGRVPRRYRGKDIFYWMDQMGFFNRTVGSLDSPQKKFSANPHLSGKNGGHTISLHLFSRNGIRLLGHAIAGDGERMYFAGDLKQSLEKVDKFETNMTHLIDRHIETLGLSIPGEVLPDLHDGYHAEEINDLDLISEGIHTIIWAQGFNYDYSLVKLPVTDSDGFPVAQRGVTQYPGLYFVGMPFLHNQKSGLLLGVNEDAVHIAAHIASPRS